MHRATLSLLLLLSGCDRAEVKDCRERLLSALDSPSSYREVDASTVAVDPTTQSVSIEYDFQNRYGAMIRDEALCQYPIESGAVDTSKTENFWPHVATQIRGMPN